MPTQTAATQPPMTVHPLAMAFLQAEAAEESCFQQVQAAGEGWGEKQYAMKRPLEAARIAARREWLAAGCPVQVVDVEKLKLQDELALSQELWNSIGALE